MYSLTDFELWNWKKETSLKMESRRPERSSHALLLLSLCRPQSGRDLPCISNWKVTALQPQQEKGRFSPCLATAQPMRDCHNSANEKPPHFALPVSPNRLFVCNSSSQLPLFLYEIRVLSFVSQDLPSVFARACWSQIAILCHSWINRFYW